MDISIDEILEEEFIMNMNSEASYNQKLKPIYDLPFVEFLDFIKSIIAAADKNGQMKMIHYLIRYVDCFEFYEKTIPKLVFEQASLEIFRYYLKNKRFGDTFVKYVGHQKTRKLIENQITFITSFREFKVNDFLIWLDYIVKLDGISILSKSKFFKENLFNDLSVIIHPPLGCYLNGYSFKGNYVFVNNKKISKDYDTYAHVQLIYLYVLYHEIGHAIQRENNDCLFQYYHYRLQKEKCFVFDMDFYHNYQNYFEQEITSNLIAMKFLSQDSAYSQESTINYSAYSNFTIKYIKLLQISKEYTLVDRKMTELLKKNPEFKMYQLEYGEDHELKSVQDLICDKRERKFHLDGMNIDYMDLYAHLIMNRLNLLTCEQFLEEVQNYSMIELSEVGGSIDYILEKVLELLNFLQELSVEFSWIEEMIDKVTEKRSLLNNYQQELYRKKEIVDLVKNKNGEQCDKEFVLKI